MRARTLIGWAGLASFVGALGCAGAFASIGSRLAPDGTLIEPFFLIPVGWLLLLIAVVLGAVYLGMALAGRIHGFARFGAAALPVNATFRPHMTE